MAKFRWTKVALAIIPLYQPQMDSGWSYGLQCPVTGAILECTVLLFTRIDKLSVHPH